MFRIGFGYDCHRFQPGDHVPIGGIKIPFHKGIQAHSDGDVLLHAIGDAILGALALGDLGQHFPDNDDQYAGVDSRILLADIVSKMQQEGYHISNIDSTIIAEKPKCAPYVQAMRESIAGLLQVEIKAVSVKATTNEKMGWIGRQEGLAAEVVVLLARSNN